MYLSWDPSNLTQLCACLLGLRNAGCQWGTVCTTGLRTHTANSFHHRRNRHCRGRYYLSAWPLIVLVTYTERLRRKAVHQPMHLQGFWKLTRVIHKFDTMTHHRHLVQRGLSIEQNVTIVSLFKEIDSLSILEMSLDNPAELQTDGFSSFPVFQVDSLSCILDIVSSTRVG
jgi:hypothetical protein